MRSFKFGSSMSAIGVMLACATPSWAQDAADSGESGIRDIVVTAQKNASGESSQRVPLAITAISSEIIASSQATNITDVARIAPNTELQTASTLPGFANFAIRGIGNSGSVSSIDPAVNIVVDGMVYDFQGATIIDTFDVETVEILRGPQGILFGRNTTGGAVSVRTKRPTNDFQARAEITIGNYGRFDLSGLVSGAVVPDKLMVKLAILRRAHDGYFTDRNGGTFVAHANNPAGIEPGSIQGRLPDADTIVLRPTLVWKPTDRIDISLMGEYVRIQGGSTAAQPVPGFTGGLLAAYGYTPPTGSFETNVNLDGFTDTSAVRLTGEVNIDVGPGVITSITGYRDVDYDFAFDADGTPFTIIEFPDNSVRSRQYSQELRFASTFSEDFRFTAGGYYDDHNIDLIEKRFQSSSLGGVTPGIASTVTARRGAYSQKAKSSALFANVDVFATDALTLSAGGRYTWDQKSLDLIPLTVCTGITFTGCNTAVSSFKNKWHNFSPKVAAQYKFNKDVSLFASWTRGFRSGNYNGRATAVGQVGPANPETVESAEIGFKSTFWDRKARMNISLFRTKYSDIQRTVLVGLSQTLANAASATITGAEVEATLRPLQGLELLGSVGYTDAKYERFDGLNLNGIAGIQPQDGELAKKLKFDRVPKYTAYGAASYTLDVPGIDKGITARVDYSYRSSFFTDVINTASLSQKGYGVLGASLTAETDNFRLSIFGRNLTDVHYIDLANTLVVPIRYGGEPRTYGATLTVSY